MYPEAGSLDAAQSPSAADDATTTDVAADSSPASDVSQVSSTEERTQVDADEQAREDYQKGLREAIAEAAKVDGQEDKTDPEGDPNAERKEGSEKGKADEADKSPEQKAKDQEVAEDEDEDDFSNEPFGKHPRFKKILSQRNEFREQSQQLQQEVEQLKGPAEQYRQINDFVQTHGVSPQEVAEALSIAALAKTNPDAAREALTRHLDFLNGVTGNQIPQDLQQEVDAGTISPDHARELARTRAQSRLAQQQVQETRQQMTQRDAEIASQARQNAVRQIEQRLMSEDPDYKRLQPWVVRDLQAQMAAMSPEQRPRTPEQAVKLFNSSLQRIREEMKQMMPRKPEVKPTVTGAHTGASPSTTAQPRNMREAMMQAAGISTG